MLSKFAEVVLSAMLTIMPIETNQSYVPMDVCDENCQVTPICHVEGECEVPHSDFKIFLNKKFDLIMGGENLEEMKALEKVAYEHSFLRRETQNEILIRYAIIAQAISEVSYERSGDICNDYCYENDLECKQQCKKSVIWHWDRLSLVASQLTFAMEETGFKGDAHMGVISGAGDCKLKWDSAKNASYYGCKSWCNGQVQIGNAAYENLNLTKDDIVGVDLLSTKNCFTAITLAATKSRGYCSNKDKVSWVGGMFSLYGSGYSCNLDIMNKREKRFWWSYNLINNGSKKNIIKEFYNNSEVISSVTDMLTASAEGGDASWN